MGSAPGDVIGLTPARSRGRTSRVLPPNTAKILEPLQRRKVDLISLAGSNNLNRSVQRTRPLRNVAGPHVPFNLAFTAVSLLKPASWVPATRRRRRRRRTSRYDRVPTPHDEHELKSAQKPKFKVGKDKAKASNFTDTSFKSKGEKDTRICGMRNTNSHSHCDGTPVPLNSRTRCRPAVQA